MQIGLHHSFVRVTMEYFVVFNIIKIMTILGEDVGVETRTLSKGETRLSPLLDVFDLLS